MALTSTATITIDAPPDRVCEVITDPLTYPEWLLGAQKIRKVDAAWPQPGSRFHHTVGAGPLRVSDHTSVVCVDEPERFELLAHIGPLGAARVTFVLHERDGRTEIELDEVPEGGLMRTMWSSLGRAALALGIWGRNEVSLQKLKAYIEDSGAEPRANRRERDTVQRERDTVDPAQ